MLSATGRSLHHVQRLVDGAPPRDGRMIFQQSHFQSHSPPFAQVRLGMVVRIARLVRTAMITVEYDHAELERVLGASLRGLEIPPVLSWISVCSTSR